MNYIVFDLEWNQSPGGKKYSNSRLPFEIIEIGAVKMNEQREVVDVFQRLVKPQVYNWIHDSIHEVIHVDYKDLADGVDVYKRQIYGSLTFFFADTGNGKIRIVWRCV